MPDSAAGLEAHVRTISLASLVSLPFLVPVHLPPIPSFHAEWLAGVIGLWVAAISLWRTRSTELAIPSIALVPAVFLGAVLLHAFAGLFQQQSLFYSIYLVLAIVLMTAGAEQVRALGKERFTAALAHGFVFGSLAQCLVAALQVQHVANGGLVAPLLNGYGVYGNLGQQNHLTHYLWLGILSLLYLYARAVVGRPSFVAGTTVLAIITAYTTSRSGLLYPLACGLLAWVCHRRIVALPCGRRIQIGLLTACALALVAQALPVWYPPPARVAQSSGMERLVTSAVSATNGSIRFELLSTAIRSVRDRPLVGHGPGSVPWQSLAHAPGDPADAFGAAEHFHNIIANWMVEFGIVVTVAALFLLVGWWRRAQKTKWSAELLWAMAILLIGALHSLLEYPLWYSFFLAPAALLLGASDPLQRDVRLSRLSRLSLIPIFALSCLLLGLLWRDHANLSRIYLLPPRGPEAEVVWKKQVDELVQLHRDSMFSPLINGMLILTADIDLVHLDNKRQVCHAAMHFSPAPAVLFKCAALEALAGNAAGAHELTLLGRRSFPARIDQFGAEMATLSARFPELTPLVAELRSTSAPTAASDR